jgi:hypothetical protein
LISKFQNETSMKLKIFEIKKENIKNKQLKNIEEQLNELLKKKDEINNEINKNLIEYRNIIINFDKMKYIYKNRLFVWSNYINEILSSPSSKLENIMKRIK